MVNCDMLRQIMGERGVTIEALAREIGVDDSTIYRKLNADGKTFTLAQVDRIKAVLGLDRKTAEAIFFGE